MAFQDAQGVTAISFTVHGSTTMTDRAVTLADMSALESELIAATNSGYITWSVKDDPASVADLGVPTTEFAVGVNTIYARMTGNDDTGDGTLAAPFRTMQRAVREVPMVVPPGQRYVVDASGIAGVKFTETLPEDYALPPFTVAETIDFNFDSIDSPYFPLLTGITIQATPQIMVLSPTTDATFVGADGVWTSDPVTQLRIFTLNVARASWGANALKGKFAIGSGSNIDHCTIYESDTTYIKISHTVALTGPVRIMEPSAELTGSGNANLAKGALNAMNIGSFGLFGIKIISSQGWDLNADGCGVCAVDLCDLESPSIVCSTGSGTPNRVFASWIHTGLPYLGSNLRLQRGLISDTGGDAIFGVAPTMPNYRRMVIDAPAGNIEVFNHNYESAVTPLLKMRQTLLRNGLADGFVFHGSVATMERVDIYGFAGDGISCNTGSGYLSLSNVRTTGAVNGGVGVNVQDGMVVRVDSLTSAAAPGTELRGTGGDMVVGGGAARLWTDFVSGASGRPALNELDLVAVAGAGGTFSDGTPVPAYVSGTGSRLYQ
jgi:hypothetical protein